MIDDVKKILDDLGAAYAVVGGMAVIARGHARVTVDFDFFTTDTRVLQEARWEALRQKGVSVDVRKGDLDDPLAGVVRIGSKPEQIDIVVGRRKWEQRIIERAEPLDVEGRQFRVPLTSDLILLKLSAGGPIDQQDIVRLLAVGPREHLIREVDEKIGDL
ncbi:MAG TPA: nucleotidyltransferase, partial [Thermoanaerobaculia bacterium]|nr:nucleotidyltransferase [Thermoanaerobaculia bacterium]